MKRVWIWIEHHFRVIGLIIIVPIILILFMLFLWRRPSARKYGEPYSFGDVLRTIRTTLKTERMRAKVLAEAEKRKQQHVADRVDEVLKETDDEEERLNKLVALYDELVGSRN